MFGFRSPAALFGVGHAGLASMRRRRNARKFIYINRSYDGLGAYHATSAVLLAWLFWLMILFEYSQNSHKFYNLFQILYRYLYLEEM